MFGLGKTNKNMEIVHQRLKMNAENNYRDATMQDLKEMEDLFEDLKSKGKISKRQIEYYSAIIEKYRLEFKGFSHKEQIASW